MRKNNRPDFLGIGAQKSATRWLYRRLSQHPEVYLTYIKELHYFDKLRGLGFFDRFSERSWKKATKKFSLKKSQHLSWMLKYTLGRYNDDWYSSLFAAAGERKSGEITPEYSGLPVRDIKVIKEINPDLRIIYLLRDPVSRAWSHFRMQIRHTGKRIEDLSDEEVIKWLDSEVIYEKGNYYDNLSRWMEVFPENQILIGYLEEVANTPSDLIRRVQDHIGIAPINFDQDSLEEKNHVGIKVPFKDSYKDFLREKYRDHNEKLYDALKNPIIKNWI